MVSVPPCGLWPLPEQPQVVSRVTRRVPLRVLCNVMQPVASILYRSVIGLERPGRGGTRRQMANESTVIRVVSLPEGRDWVWYGDLNVIGVSDRLDEAGQMVAVLDLQAQWRRTMIELVPPRRPSERCRAKSAPPSYSFMRNAANSEGAD